MSWCPGACGSLPSVLMSWCSWRLSLCLGVRGALPGVRGCIHGVWCHGVLSLCPGELEGFPGVLVSVGAFLVSWCPGDFTSLLVAFLVFWCYCRHACCPGERGAFKVSLVLPVVLVSVVPSWCPGVLGAILISWGAFLGCWCPGARGGPSWCPPSWPS